ncbi:MAG: response regulator [Candidatus Omnitrophica bacterium]|nr:response regulator [Candidatus Omnitrophota bacterium]
MSKRILIVDDEKEILDILDKKLSLLGYQVIKMASGREAVEKTQKYLPDLVLMDIMIPDIDGPEAVRILQDDPVTKNIPILFLSGIIAKDEGPSSSITVGGIHYPTLGKPFTAQELLDKINEIFNH